VPPYLQLAIQEKYLSWHMCASRDTHKTCTKTHLPLYRSCARTRAGSCVLSGALSLTFFLSLSLSRALSHEHTVALAPLLSRARACCLSLVLSSMLSQIHRDKHMLNSDGEHATETDKGLNYHMLFNMRGCLPVFKMRHNFKKEILYCT
jgi:hypothetical protein